MRQIWLSDRERHQRPYAALELGAYLLYPEDEPSRLQALQLLEMEYQRWLDVGQENFVYSQLVQQILTASRKSIGQRIVVGLVGVAMQCLSNANRTVSLETAANIVSEYANTISAHPILIFKGGEWVRRDTPLIGDAATIKKHFRRYRSVAHICTAELATAEYMTPRTGFDPQPEADACFIATALCYQNLFRKVGNFESWRLWEIQYSPPEPELLVAYFPSIDSVRNLMGPWLDAMVSATNKVSD